MIIGIRGLGSKARHVCRQRRTNYKARCYRRKTTHAEVVEELTKDVENKPGDPKSESFVGGINASEKKGSARQPLEWEVNFELRISQVNQ